MEELNLRVKLAVLWVFIAVGMSAAMLLFLMLPGVIEEVIAGEIEAMEISQGVLFMFSLFWLVPLAMAFFSITLKRTSNRVLNIALGLFFAVFYVVDMSGDLIKGEKFFAHHVLTIVMVVAAVRIFLYALKWQREAAKK
jgi:hypothetical protein